MANSAQAVSKEHKDYLLGRASKLSFSNKLSTPELIELSAFVQDESEFLKAAQETKDVKTLKQLQVRETTVMSDEDYRHTIPDRALYKVVIIGSGPAAFTAAIYAARANLHPIVFTGNPEDLPGGQLMTTTEIENYPGFINGVHGQKLMARMKEQAQRVGTEVLYSRIEGCDLNCNPKKLYYVQNYTIKTVLAESVIIATGAYAKKLSLPGEVEYWGNGVSACAVCDGPLKIYQNVPLVVIGGGDTACEEASFLSNIGSAIYMAVRTAKMRASKIMKERVEKNPKIKILYWTEVLEIKGDGKKTTSVRIVTKQPNVPPVEQDLIVGGLFYAIGHTPSTSFLKNIFYESNGVVMVKEAENSTKYERVFLQKDSCDIKLDEQGYIVTLKGTTYCLKPNSPTPFVDPEKADDIILSGVFACGDCQDKIYRQAVTAAGTGCMSALEAERYLQALHQH